MRWRKRVKNKKKDTCVKNDEGESEGEDIGWRER